MVVAGVASVLVMKVGDYWYCYVGSDSKGDICGRAGNDGGHSRITAAVTTTGKAAECRYDLCKSLYTAQ